jgi:signal peptide peptidase SppA
MEHDMNCICVGDRIKVVPGYEHVPGQDVGVVRQVIDGALGIEFDSTPGEVHQWYVPSEVMVTEATEEPPEEEEAEAVEPEEPAEGAPMEMARRGGKINRIMTVFYREPLAILPAKMMEIIAFLNARAAYVSRMTDANGRSVAVDSVKADQYQRERQSREAALLATIQAIDHGAVRRSDGVVMSGRVAVLPVFGILAQRVGMMERSSGGISTEEIGATLDGLVSDKQIKAVAMVYDSPGGSVAGVKELGDKIRAARDQKKIVGIADPMAASAAYWLLSQSSTAWVSETGQVGSIGVITGHEDISKMEESLGVKTTLIASSPYKAEASPYGPLSDEARAELQSKVNAYHQMFVESVAKGRGVKAGVVEKTFGGGRMLMAEQAKSAGMVDRIGSLSDAVRRLGGEVNVAAESGATSIIARGTPRTAAMARARALEVSAK